MSTIPKCPKHQSSMRQNKRGWFCPRHVGVDDEGNPIYCDQQMAGPAHQKDPVAFQKPRQGVQDAPGSTNEWGLALRFAGEVYRGTGKASEALELAAAARALLP